MFEKVFRQLLDGNGVTDDDNRSSVGIFILMKISFIRKKNFYRHLLGIFQAKATIDM